MTRSSREYEAADKPGGEWNTHEIAPGGPSSVVFVDGRKVHEATAATVVPGRIALQSEGVEIQCRRVGILPLGLG